MILRYQGKWPKSILFNGFFEKVFEMMNAELNQIAVSFYLGEKENVVFECIERQWVGIFNNAVIKSYKFDEVTTLQEYSVPLAEKQYGRADYLVRLDNIDMLFEAKMCEEKGTVCSDEMMEADYLKVIQQATKYLKFNERGSYKEELYLIAIYFGWIRNEGVLEKVKRVMDAGKSTTDKTDFCTLFCNESSGVWVYGRVVKPNDSILLNQRK